MPRTMTDAIGQSHPVAGTDARIVSLVPSLTELLFDLDLGSQTVGRTAFCVHPQPRVQDVPKIGGTKTVHMDRIQSLKPTHVLVNIDETPKSIAIALADLGCRVIVTHPIEVRDTIDLFRLIGGLFDREAEAEILVTRFEHHFQALVEAAKVWPDKRVLYLIWKDPWMTVGPETFIARMLALARWHTVPTATDVRYPVITLDEALLHKVDRVLFASEPFPFRASHLDDFRKRFPTHAEKATAVDGERLSWYGSRTIKGLAYLARLAVPEFHAHPQPPVPPE